VKRLQSLKLEGLKRPPILISVLGVIVLLAVWWLGWMSPEAGKLSTINQQEQSRTSQLQTEQSQLQADKQDSALVAHDTKALAVFAKAVPPAAEAGPLTTQLYNLSKSTGVTLQSLTDDSTTAPLAGASIGSIPIAISLKGTHRACLVFLADLYKLPRLITVSSVTPTPGSASGSTPPNVLGDYSSPYTMTLSATAYFYGTATPAG
jgi:Tfp pilus assembly protein PilO